MRQLVLAATLVAITGAALYVRVPHESAPAKGGAPSPRELERERDAPAGEPFWEWRLSYPTGRYSARWYLDARPRHGFGVPGPEDVRAFGARSAQPLDSAVGRMALRNAPGRSCPCRGCREPIRTSSANSARRR